MMSLLAKRPREGEPPEAVQLERLVVKEEARPVAAGQRPVRPHHDLVGVPDQLLLVDHEFSERKQLTVPIYINSSSRENISSCGGSPGQNCKTSVACLFCTGWFGSSLVYLAFDAF